MQRTLRIESLVHGGDGLARDDGRVLFVPLTAPGDLVSVETDPAERSNRARLLEVIEPGAVRRDPPCPLVGACGGCQWQQVSSEAQLAAKEANVRDVLVRIGRFVDPPVLPIVPSPREWRYRRRLRAHLTRDGWGFSGRASNELVEVAACLLVESDVESLAHRLAQALHSDGAKDVETFAIDAVAGKGSAHLALRTSAKAAKWRRRSEKLLAEIPALAGVVLTIGEDAPRLVGSPTLIDSDHRGLRVRPDLFAQANRLGARVLAQRVAESIAPGSSVLEFFAGTGTLTVQLIDRASRYVGTEGDGPALDLLRAALRESRVPSQLIAGPGNRVVRGLVDGGERFDHVVLDPPRTGAKEMIRDVARLATQAITYVSCDAATFARDAAALVVNGWSLVSVEPVDLFPHTHHVELVGVFGK